MRYLLAAPLFGLIGYLVAQAVLEHTGSESLAALCFCLAVAVMQWAGEIRRRHEQV